MMVKPMIALFPWPALLPPEQREAPRIFFNHRRETLARRPIRVTYVISVLEGRLNHTTNQISPEDPIYQSEQRCQQTSFATVCPSHQPRQNFWRYLDSVFYSNPFPSLRFARRPGKSSGYPTVNSHPSNATTNNQQRQHL